MKKDQGHIIIIKKSEETKIKMPFKSFLNFKKQKDKYIILVREKKKLYIIFRCGLSLCSKLLYNFAILHDGTFGVFNNLTISPNPWNPTPVSESVQTQLL